MHVSAAFSGSAGGVVGRASWPVQHRPEACATRARAIILSVDPGGDKAAKNALFEAVVNVLVNRPARLTLAPAGKVLPPALQLPIQLLTDLLPRCDIPAIQQFPHLLLDSAHALVRRTADGFPPCLRRPLADLPKGDGRAYVWHLFARLADEFNTLRHLLLSGLLARGGQWNSLLSAPTITTHMP